MTRIDSEVLTGASHRRVLAELRRRGPLARVEIAALTGFSRPTVTQLTAELIGAGVLRECPSDPALEPEPAEADAGGGGESALRTAPSADSGPPRGRPRVRLELVADALHVVGVKVAPDGIAVAATNFAGRVLAQQVVGVRARALAPEAVAALIEPSLARTLADAGLALAEIAGVGIGLPGFIDAAAGVCRWSPCFDRADVPFAEVMATRLGQRVLLDNDANLVTLGEQWFGLGREVDSILVVTVEHGVGMGFVVDGRLYRGAMGIGSEFGHTKIQRNGALCRCGQRGCIEAYLADYALVREASLFMPAVDVTDPLAIAPAFDRLAERARDGHAGARGVFARAGDVLGLGLANLINILNPPLVILSGRAMTAADLLWPTLHATLTENTVTAEAGATRIEVHRQGDDAWARGAAALVLAHPTGTP